MDPVNLEEIFVRINQFLNEACLDGWWNAKRDDALEIVIIHRSSSSPNSNAIKIERELHSVANCDEGGIAAAPPPPPPQPPPPLPVENTRVDGASVSANRNVADARGVQARRPQSWEECFDDDGEVKLFDDSVDSYFESDILSGRWSDDDEDDAGIVAAPPVRTRNGRVSIPIMSIATALASKRKKRVPNKKKTKKTGVSRGELKDPCWELGEGKERMKRLTTTEMTSKRKESEDPSWEEEKETEVRPERKRTNRGKFCRADGTNAASRRKRGGGGRPLLFPELKRNADGVIECPICGETFQRTPRALTHYRKVHKKLVFPCEKCPREFYDLPALKFHEDIIHNDGKGELVCQQCGMRFHHISGIKYHVKRLHSDLTSMNGVEKPKLKCSFTGTVWNRVCVRVSERERQN